MQRMLSFVISALLCVTSNAQTYFQRVIGGAGDDEAFCATATNDGGYVLGGYTAEVGGDKDAWFVKLDAAGAVLWSRTWGGAGNEYVYDISERTNGQLWCSGSCDLDDDGSSEAYVLALDAEGVVLWIRTFDMPTLALGYNFTFTADGGAVASFIGQSASYSMGLVRMDPVGNVLWTTNYRLGLNTLGGGVVERPNGELLAVAASYVGGDALYNVQLLRLDAFGALIDNQEWSASALDNDGAYVIEPLSDGGYLIAGESHEGGFGPDHVLLIRLDSDLQTIWAKRYGSAGRSVRSFAGGGVEGGGFFSAVHDYSGDGGEDMGLLRTDANGELLWSRAYGGPEMDVCHKAISCATGGFLVVGYTEGFDAQGRDMYVVRTDAIGNVPSGPGLCQTTFAVTSDTTFTYASQLQAVTIIDAAATAVPVLASQPYLPARDSTLCVDLNVGAVEREALPTILLSPMPCDDQLRIDRGADRNTPMLVRLLDACGRELSLARSQDGVVRLNTSDLAVGGYVLHVQSGELYWSQRVIVVH